jgi:hypothetical protein
VSTPHDIPAAAPDSPSVGLRWAVKRSFLDYLARTPGSRAYVAGGVTANSVSEVTFPPAADAVDQADPSGALVYRFQGEVRYIGHGGLLHVAITDPIVTLAGDIGTLTIASVDEEDRHVRVELATLTVSARTAGDDGISWEATDVRLAPAGVAVFGDVYQAGELMAPLYVYLPPTKSSA